MIGNLTEKQREIIHDNLVAFENNFGEPKIVRADYGSGLYVFWPADADSYIQYCYDIKYCDGWLYGCVQAFHRHSMFDEAYKKSEMNQKYGGDE